MPKRNELKEAFDRIEKLLEFPVDFPIKVVGRQTDDFVAQIADAVRVHIPGFDPADLSLRSSAQGSWLSVTIPVRAESREQLETLYLALGEHPLVHMVL